MPSVNDGKGNVWGNISDFMGWNKKPENASDQAETAAKGAAAGALLGAATPLGVIGGAAVGAAAASAIQNSIGDDDQAAIKEAKKVQTGSADSTVSMVDPDTTEMREAWVAARSEGPVLKALAHAETPGELSAAVAKFAQTNNLSADQQKNLGLFLEGVRKAGQVEDSDNESFNGRGYIDVLMEGAANPGVNAAQLELIANGDFTLEAYKDMVKNGDSST